MTTPQMDWLDDERRRSRNATPWLPPLSCDLPTKDEVMGDG